MSVIAKRGALIVFEGGDRCGKTTQCQKLVTYLRQLGNKVEHLSFPDRTTRIGKMISEYLEKKVELDDHAVHLLFSANRWEAALRMTTLLHGGTSLVVDRYAYSGVAFSASKGVKGMTLDWCRVPDIGLPRPDLVLFLDMPPEEAATRGQYGNERYEKLELQKTVRNNFRLLQEDYWKVIDASQSVDDVAKEVCALAKSSIQESANRPLERLWT